MKLSRLVSLSAITIAVFSACVSNQTGMTQSVPQKQDGPALSETPESQDPGSTGGEGTEEGTPEQDRSPMAQGRPDPQNREELTVAFSSGSIQLDPRKSFLASEAQIFTGLYEGLFSYNPLTLEPLPAAAESWKVSDDKKTWTFTIRSNARYWNGDSLKSQHFRDAWISLIDPAGNNPYSSLFDIIAATHTKG